MQCGEPGQAHSDSWELHAPCGAGCGRLAGQRGDGGERRPLVSRGGIGERRLAGQRGGIGERGLRRAEGDIGERRPADQEGDIGEGKSAGERRGIGLGGYLFGKGRERSCADAGMVASWPWRTGHSRPTQASRAQTST
ncbi:hypothetical protein BSAF29S_00323 [Bacillus safensis subsp. safensis]